MTTRSYVWQGRVGACAVAGALALACGRSEEAPQPSGPPMTSAVAPTPASAVNHAPVIDRVRLEPEDPIPGGRVRAVVQASDPDGGSVQLRYAWSLGGEPTGADTPEITLEQGHKGQDVEVSVIASDGNLESSPAHTRSSLGNRGPQLLGVALEPHEGLQVGGLVKAVPDAQDPDGDPLRYEVTWRVNDKSAPESGLELSTKGLRRGDRIQAVVRATDGKVTTEPVTSAEIQIGNTAPKIVSRPETRFEDGVFHYSVEAKDADGDRNLRYSLANAPGGMTIDRLGGEIRWQPTAEQTGKHSIEVVVEDSQGGQDLQTFELTIGRQPGKPTLDSLPVPAAPAPQ